MVTNNFALTLQQVWRDYQDTDIIVVSNDTDVNILTIRVFNGTTEITYGELASGTITFVKDDGNIVQGNLTIGAASITYTMGTNEIAIPGTVRASIQLYGASGERLTPAKFRFRVESDLSSAGATPSTTDLIAIAALNSSLSAHTAETMQYEGRKFTINNPYKSGGSLSLKGQLHCHTTGSDGAQTPLAVATAYKTAGYDFLAITDHDNITPDPVVAGLTFIQSVEESISHHIVAYDITERSGSLDVQTVLNFHEDRNKITSIAHPNWINMYQLTADEMAKLSEYNFTEVYNNVLDSYAESQWDYALSTYKKVFATAVDDCHDITGAKFNGGWVVVFTETNTKDAILESLRNGNFYASTGNDISISFSGNEITASSAASSTITFIGWNGKALQTTAGVTTATYTIKGDEGYIRVRSVRTSDSKYAWSQPIFIDVIGGDDKNFTKQALDNLEGTSGFASNLPVYINSNVVQIATCETAEGWLSGIWNGGAGTYSSDSTNYKVGNAGAKTTGTLQYTGMHLVKNMNLSIFSDGSASDGSDYICMAIYFDATSFTNLGVNGISISFLCDTKPTVTNTYLFTVGKSTLVAGWNFVKIQKSSFTVTGIPDWAAVKGVQIFISNAPYGELSVTVDNIQMIRKDPENSYPNPFQYKVGDVWKRDFSVIGNWFVGVENGELVCREISSQTTRQALLSTVGYTNFVSRSIVKTKTNKAYSHSIGNSYNNIITAHWYGTGLTLNAYYNTIQEIGITKTVPPLAVGDIVEFIIAKNGNVVTLTVYRNFDYSTPYVINGKCSLISKLLLGMQCNLEAIQSVLSMSIASAKSAYHADVADISQRIATKYKAGAFTADDINPGEIGIDTTNNRLYVKYGGVVKYASLT